MLGRKGHYMIYKYFFCILKNVGVYEPLTAVGPDITVKALDRGLCNRGDTILCLRRAPANKRKLCQSPIKD